MGGGGGGGGNTEMKIIIIEKIIDKTEKQRTITG
jgi:hypothetical protein